MARTLSLIDTLGVMHANLLAVAEGPQGYITRHGDGYRVWLRTKHERFWQDPRRYTDADLETLQRRLAGGL